MIARDREICPDKTVCLVPEVRKLSEWLLRAARTESEKSTIAGKRVDEQQQVALILKGSSLVPDGTGRQQVSRTGRRKLIRSEIETGPLRRITGIDL